MRKHLFYTAVFVCSSASCVHAQRVIHGHVYSGQSDTSPADSVKLYTSSHTAYSNKNGSYAIVVKENIDTLYVQYSDRKPMYFTVTDNTIPNKFDIYLNNSDFFKNEKAHILKDVEVHTQNYQKDSLATREKYGKLFTYEKPKFRYGKEWILTPLGGGVDIDALIRLAQINQTKRKLRDKRFALQSEEQLYIDNRFTRSLAGNITHLDDDAELFKFMEWCRPSAPQLREMNDLELSQYIAENYKEYVKCRVAMK